LDLATSVATLESALKLPPALCRLLVLRGMTGHETARAFLKPRLDRLHDAHCLAGLDDAVARITTAIRQKQIILVHGDYDVDGICGAVLLTRTLRALGAQVEPFVPHRMSDGYDLGAAGVRAAADARARLILTVDCGTVAHEAVRQAKAAGIDVIVTDHHTPGDTLPDAVAVVNPNRHDCSYPFKGLAGVGVAFKLCEALVAALHGDAAMLRWHLDLVALATIADLAPLSGENRILAAFGLRVLAQTRNPGLAALLRTVGIDVSRPITAGQVSHVLAPRINAVGRMGAAARGLRLLMADTEAEAESLAKLSEDENRTRRAVDRETLREALEMLEADYDPARDRGIVLASHKWHPGVIGIVASRVVERLHRPTILIAIDPTSRRARGSGRSIPGFHLYEAIRSCAHLLERYGGHRQAAGLEIQPEHIAAFRREFDSHARSVLTAEQLVAVVGLDLELRLPDANAGLLALLRHFGPFGIGNPMPTFVARRVALGAPPKLVGEGHARLLLVQDGARLPAIGFGMADQLGALIPGRDTLDVAFHLQEHRWRGSSSLQARLIDTRPAP
jgi:single-stranded-DNA-specific exonuclease